MLTLITGGARSGKSRHALDVAQRLAAKGVRIAFIATAQAFDEEMARRIEAHREQRRQLGREPEGAGCGDFVTIEEPLALDQALGQVPSDVEVAVIDCLTVWLGNVMHDAESRSRPWPKAPEESAHVEDFFAVLDRPLPFHVIAVTNEVGLGLVPTNAMSRAFRDLAGRVNQETAVRASTVVMTVSGIPLVIKGGTM